LTDHPPSPHIPSPTAVSSLLHDVVVDAIGLSIDAADPTLADALTRLLRGPEGPLSDLRVQVSVRPHLRLPDPPPLQMPISPGMLAALDPGSLGLGPARVSVLGRVLLGVRESSDLAAAVGHHPVLQNIVAATRSGPVPWLQLVADLALHHEALAESEPTDARAYCAAVLDLASAARVWVNGHLEHPFEVSVHWRVSGSAMLSRRLARPPADRPFLALRPPSKVEPDTTWAPAMVCRHCGLDGIGFVVRDGGMHTDPTDVRRAFRLHTPSRRFVALDTRFRHAGPPCPQCGQDDGIGPLGLSAGVMVAWATIAASFLPDCPAPLAPAALTPALLRIDLRLAIRDALGGAPVPLPELLTRVVQEVCTGPPGPLQEATQTALRYGALAELTTGLRRGASLGRAGLLSVGLAPESLEWVPEDLRAAVVLAVQHLVDAGAVWDDALEPCVAAGGNASLLPCPVGDGSAAPEFPSLDPDHGGVRGRLAEHLERVAPQGVEVAAVLHALQRVRALRGVPGMRILTLDPELLVVYPRSATVGCSQNHRRVDVPEAETERFVGLPCFGHSCTASLELRPREYGATARWYEQAKRRPVRSAPSTGSGWTLKMGPGQLTVEVVAD
jgi:hypothetical protein